MRSLKFLFVACLIGLLSACSSKNSNPTVTRTSQPTEIPIQVQTASPTQTELPKTFGPLKIDANPKKGFYWPYFLYIPSVIKSNHFLVVPNNSGKNDNFSIIEQMALTREVNDHEKWAITLGMPLLVPVFPRPDNETDGTIASQYLGRGTLESIWCKKYTDLCRQDLQLIAMIDDARVRLKDMGINIADDVFIWGYSATGMFSSRFVILHPDRVKAAAFGGNGWTTVPIDKWEGVTFPFPYGIGDLENLTDQPFDLGAFCKVSIFSYMGELDNNGWAMPWYIGNKYNRVGIYKSIISKFGNTSTALINSAKTIFDNVGCIDTFKIYPGMSHQYFPESESDVLNFFIQHSD